MPNLVRLLILIIIFPCFHALSQGYAGSSATAETRYLAEMPTAGMLKKNTFSVTSEIFANGGMLIQTLISPLTNFSLGISYSGSNIIGYNKMTFQGIPGFEVKIRLLNETKTFPAIAIGASNQGHDNFSHSNRSFESESPGVFIVAGKYYTWAVGGLSIHGGAYYSFEPLPDNRFVNFYAGAEQTISSHLSLIAEFRTAFEKDKRVYQWQKVNVGAAWSFYKNFTLGFFLKDILQSSPSYYNPERIITLDFINSF